MTGRNELLSPLAAWIVAAVLAATVFAVYSPALNFEFILDDHHFVGDPRVQSSGHVWEYFTTYVWSQVTGGPASFYRPVFVLWLRLNFILSETSPWGWHLLSIAKHASVALLLGLLVWKLLHDRVAALMAATLFALHPAQTESVAWVTVPDALMAAAVLGSLLLYLLYAERAYVGAESDAAKRSRKSVKSSRGQRETTSRAVWLVASAAACLASLMTKETAIIVPAIIFFSALIMPFDQSEEPQGRPKARVRMGSALRAALPFLGAAVVYFLLRINALGGRISPLTQHLPWTTVLLSWPAMLWFYVKVMLWPVHSRAFADPNLADGFTLHGVLLPGLGVCCVIALLVATCLWAGKVARRGLAVREAANAERALLLGVLLLILPILPALNLNALNPGDFLHGRYTYLSLAGLMLAVATVWHVAGHTAKNAQIVLLVAAGLVAMAFATLTVQQESMWKDDLTVFTVAHQIAPHNDPVALNLTRTHVQIALRLDEDGRCDQALPIFDEATQEYPQEWFAWAGRGECLVKLNDLPKAEQSLRRAFEISHEPRVAEQWQQVRAMMGLPPAPLP